MKLQVERVHIEAMLQVFPRLDFVREKLRFGNKAEVSFAQLNDAELDFLRDLYVDGSPELRARGAQIAILQKALREGGLIQALACCARKRSRALPKACRSAWPKAAGPPVSTPAPRSSSMKLRMLSRSLMLAVV